MARAWSAKRFLPSSRPKTWSAAPASSLMATQLAKFAVVKAVQQTAQNIELLFQQQPKLRGHRPLVYLGHYWPCTPSVLLQFIGDADVIHHQPPCLSLNTRLTRAMACIRLWPFMGLSTYMVCTQGASKPVSHISAHDHQLERVCRILEALFQPLFSPASGRCVGAAAPCRWRSPSSRS